MIKIIYTDLEYSSSIDIFVLGTVIIIIVTEDRPKGFCPFTYPTQIAF